MAEVALNSRPFSIPGHCYNAVKLAKRDSNFPLAVLLPGLPDNEIRFHNGRWVCWNYRLGAPLISWHHFSPQQRSGLGEPVPCVMTEHHSYARTVLFRVMDAITEFFSQQREEQLKSTRKPARVLSLR